MGLILTVRNVLRLDFSVSVKLIVDTLFAVSVGNRYPYFEGHRISLESKECFRFDSLTGIIISNFVLLHTTCLSRMNVKDAIVKLIVCIPTLQQCECECAVCTVIRLTFKIL